jgi:hypothetical protein
LKVIINAKIGASNVKVWSGQQRNLFRKYRSQREKSIAEIVASLEDLKDDFE